jgi:hypothetical protein
MPLDMGMPNWVKVWVTLVCIGKKPMMMEAKARKMKFVEQGKAHFESDIVLVRQVTYINRPELDSGT